MRNVLKGCRTSLEYDRSYYKLGQHIATDYPGEIFSIDFMDVNKKYKILLCIDYFSRKALKNLKN